MITIEYWHNGQLINTMYGGRNDMLGYMRAYNRMADEAQIAGRWIIASNGLKN